MTLIPPRAHETHHCPTPKAQGEDLKPIHEHGTLWECPHCVNWWTYDTGALPPGQYGRTVTCVTTYWPRWDPVRWWHIRERRRIAARLTEQMHYRVPTSIGTYPWWRVPTRRR